MVLHSDLLMQCNNTLPRGVYWKIRLLRQFAPRGPRISRSEGCKLPRVRTSQFIPTRDSELPFFFFKSRSVLEIAFISIHSRSLKKMAYPNASFKKSIFDLRYTATFLIVAVKSCFIACDNNSNAVSFLWCFSLPGSWSHDWKAPFWYNVYFALKEGITKKKISRSSCSRNWKGLTSGWSLLNTIQFSFLIVRERNNLTGQFQKWGK